MIFLKLGLCLSGGGTKAFAHIGALKAFEESHVKFDYLAGTSSGSIVATLYASGYQPEEIYDIFKKYARHIRYIDRRNLWNILKYFFKTGEFRILGLNSGEKIYQLVNQYCAKKGITNINQIKIPLVIPSVNVRDEDLYVFCSHKYDNLKLEDNIKYINDANIGAVVEASCSYPGIFVPCTKFPNMELIDGGIEENVPWREEKRIGAEKVVSVVFVNKSPDKCCNNVFEILSKSFKILCNELKRYELNGSDYLIKVDYTNSGLLNIRDSKELYNEGYQKAKKFNWISVYSL